MAQKENVIIRAIWLFCYEKFGAVQQKISQEKIFANFATTYTSNSNSELSIQHQGLGVQNLTNWEDK